MNFFLHINRNLIFLLGIITILVLIILVFTKQFKINNIDLKISETKLSNVDISEPKFAINNESEKIYITAKEGNFINKDEIFLKDNVKFKSNNFIIETEQVIFNRNKQTAKSKTKSFFKSTEATISSEGFDIYDNGNRIIFYGNSIIVLK